MSLKFTFPTGPNPLLQKSQNIYQLMIPKNTTIDEPIHLKKTAGEAVFKLKLPEGSQATLIEEWTEENKGQNDYQLEVECGPYSQLTYLVLHSANQEAKVTEKREFRIGNNAKVDVAFFCFGGAKIQSQITQTAVGHSAQMQMTVVARAQKSQLMSFKAAQIFEGKQNQGHMEMRGVAEDQAQLNLNGLIKITKTGAQTDASLNEHILNLSPKTKVDAAPALEIDTNDVKAAHSAGIHNVSEDEILYLMARGLERNQAKQMLVNGFLRSGLESVKSYPELYDKIEKIIKET